MTLNLNNVRVMPDLLEDGVWWDFETKTRCRGNVPHEQHACFRIAYGGFRYVAELDRVRAPHLAELRVSKTPGDLLRRLHAEAMLIVLRGWCNIEMDGKPFPFTPENALLLLGNADWTFVRTFIEQAADTQSAYLAEEHRQSVGNSETDSSGSFDSGREARTPSTLVAS